MRSHIDAGSCQARCPGTGARSGGASLVTAERATLHALRKRRLPRTPAHDPTCTPTRAFSRCRDPFRPFAGGPRLERRTDRAHGGAMVPSRVRCPCLPNGGNGSRSDGGACSHGVSRIAGGWAHGFGSSVVRAFDGWISDAESPTVRGYDGQAHRSQATDRSACEPQRFRWSRIDPVGDSRGRPSHVSLDESHAGASSRDSHSVTRSSPRRDRAGRHPGRSGRPADREFRTALGHRSTSVRTAREATLRAALSKRGSRAGDGGTRLVSATAGTIAARTHPLSFVPCGDAVRA